MNLEGVRARYRETPLDEQTVFPNPLTQFKRWFTEAKSAEVQEVYAMTLSSLNADGHPSSRIVLLKMLDAHGFVFYSSGGDKAAHVAGHYVSLLFFWAELERQLRIEGPAERMPEADADTYFAVRPRTSQICAWAFTQSQPAANRKSLEKAFADTVERFENTPAIPRPPQWGGYRVIPERMEFWQGHPSRLHDRIVYTRAPSGQVASGTAWTRERMAP